MQITGKLDVAFFNMEHDRRNESEGATEFDPTVYKRLERCWNVYFHGYCDQYDDIAYLKEDLAIEPGIYEVTTYGETVLLFLWDTGDKEHRRPLKGLLVQPLDEASVNDAYAKYIEKAFSI